MRGTLVLRYTPIVTDSRLIRYVREAYIAAYISKTANADFHDVTNAAHLAQTLHEGFGSRGKSGVG